MRRAWRLTAELLQKSAAMSCVTGGAVDDYVEVPSPEMGVASLTGRPPAVASPEDAPDGGCEGEDVSEWLGPDESWDAHPRPEAQKAMLEARAAGWFLRPHRGSSAKTFGRIACRRVDGGARPAQQHGLSVYKTSGPPDGSQTAASIRAALRSCTCAADAAQDSPTAKPVEVDGGRELAALRAITAAERLVGALLLLLAGRHSRKRAEELLDLAGAAVDDVERWFDDAVRREEQADRRDSEARELADALGLGHVPWPPGGGELESRLLTPVEGYLEEAGAALDAATRDSSAQARLAAARARLMEAAAALKSAPPLPDA